MAVSVPFPTKRNNAEEPGIILVNFYILTDDILSNGFVFLVTFWGMGVGEANDTIFCL